MKKMGLAFLVVMAALLFALAFPAAAAAPKAPVPASPAVLVPALAAAVPAEEHPHIHDALEAMRTAKHHLEAAAHDYEGHRVKAIEHLDQAIREAEMCEHMR